MKTETEKTAVASQSCDYSDRVQQQVMRTSQFKKDMSTCANMANTVVLLIKDIPSDPDDFAKAETFLQLEKRLKKYT